MNKEKTLTGYLLGINLLHIALCFAVMLLRRYSLFDGIYMHAGAIALCGLIWLIFAYLSALGVYMQSASQAFTYSLLCVAPISLLTGLCAVSGFFFNASGGWARFFFFGSAVNFYFRPFMLLSRVLPKSAYVYYAASIALLFLLSLIGTLLGVSAGKKKERKGKKGKTIRRKVSTEQLKEQVESEKTVEDAPAKDKKAKKAQPESKKPEADDEELVNDTDEDLQREIERLKKKLAEKQKQESEE